MERCRAFTPAAESVREARRFVRDVASGTLVDASVAELLTSELATNAVKHTQSEFEVRIKLREHGLRVEVVDGSPELPASMRDPDEHGGHGLRILGALSADWGVVAGPSSKAVWFELEPSRRDTSRDFGC